MPDGDWRVAWGIALALVVAMTWFAERTTRAHKQRPSVVDDPVWWAVHRRQVGAPNVIAVLGTSRIQVAFSGAELAAAAPGYQSVHLSITGVPPYGVLEDLAADEDFRGIALVDIAEWDLARGDAFTGAASYVERGHNLWRAPGALANRYLASHVQSRLAVLAVGGRELLNGLAARKWPEAKWVTEDRDREHLSDYTAASPQALAKKREKGLTTFNKPAMSVAAWLEQVARVEASVAKIKARGGEVVFVRLPITGKLGELAELNYPRARYWDVFAARSAGKVIHYKDVPEMAAIECPDSMHVDAKDQPALTRALVGALRARGVLSSRR